MCFVRRVYNHLSLATTDDTFPSVAVSQDEGQAHRQLEASSFILLSWEAASRYFVCYFNHSGATYRRPDRHYIEKLLDSLYHGDDDTLEDHSKVALLLTMMAEG